MDTSQLNAIMIKVMVLTSGLIGASVQLMMAPENAAGVVGSSVVLECQGSVAAHDNGVYWYEYITSTARTNIFRNGQIVSGAPNSQLYSITGESSVGQYHLNIELAFLSGGRYECLEGISGLEASSHVTVLRTAPVCTDTIQADGIVEEGEVITYTCEVAYNSTSIDWPPVMTWTGPDGAITDVIKLSTSGMTVTTSVNVTGAPGLNGVVHSVRTHFEAYGGSLPAYYATNVPTYSHSHSFNALLVHYKPTNVTIDPYRSCYELDQALACSADGNPPALYRWQNHADNTTQAGPLLNITQDMIGKQHVFTCEAYNNIRGAARIGTSPIAFRVVFANECSSGEIALGSLAWIWTLAVFVIYIQITI